MEEEHKNTNDATIDKIIVVSNGKPQTSHESTSSSVTSGGSDTIGTSSKEIDTLHIEINKEIDKLFGPTLERTRSGSDIEVIAPLRQRKRQYHSQEILLLDRPLNESVELGSTNSGIDAMHIEEPKNIIDSNPQQISILYDNQRAEIVASVTERLYNKLKKNEKVVAKMETMVDKKIMQPLNELKICSNARQRLVELSQKAIKHKRKIGIPAYTQTKKYATRVKDQEVDTQKDLQHYVHFSSLNRICTLQKNVGTETESITLRYKEAAVGSKCGTLDFMDQSTLTTNTKITYKNSFTMTDITKKCDCSTQTHILPPPRRKKRSLLSKYLRKSEIVQSRSNQNQTPIININISPIYPIDSDSSNENSECSENKLISATTESNEKNNSIKFVNFTTEKKYIGDYSNTIEKVNETENKIDDFSDDDGLSKLPRATVLSNKQIGCSDYEEMVLGRNQYPYNVKLSPSKDNHELKKVIRFKDIDVTPADCGSAKWLEKVNTSLDILSNETQCKNYKSSGSLSIDTSEFSNIKLDSSSNTTPTHSRSDMMNNAGNCISTGVKDHKLQYNNSLKYSLSESELRSKDDISSRYSYLSKDNVAKMENKLCTKRNNCNFIEDRQKFSELSIIPDNKYLSNGKLAPTEYLKQLILIRRETVAANYKTPI